MEDTSFMPNNLNDLVIFNQVMLKFEAQSGAILSRSRFRCLSLFKIGIHISLEQSV